MAYIGRGTETISNVEVLDNLTFDGSASYTLQKSSVNFVPSSANNLLISISGVVQQGNFSVSGSTITFDTTVSGSDTCDWILHYGTGLITTVADGAITEAKLGSNAVTNAKITDGTIANAKLVNSSITLNGSAVSLGGSASVANTPAFRATRPTNQTLTDGTNTKIQFNSEDFDTDSCYDNATNYRFTPTVAGKYLIGTQIRMLSDGNTLLATTNVILYKNGSAHTSSPTNFRANNINGQTYFLSDILTFNGSTDYVEVYVNADVDSGGIIAAGGDACVFFGYKLIGA